MTIKEIQQEILRMKKEQDVCILAHAYQGQEILEVADYMGDSYGLSVQAARERLQRRDHVRCAFYGRNLQSIKPGQKSLACKPGCRMSNGRAA